MCFKETHCVYLSLSKSDLSALECSENPKTTNISLVIVTKLNFVTKKIDCGKAPVSFLTFRKMSSHQSHTGRHKLINQDIVMTNVLCEVHSHCLDERKAFIKICGSDYKISICPNLAWYSWKGQNRATCLEREMLLLHRV